MTALEGGSLVDRLFAKANADYHRMYDFRGTVVHLAVRFGDFVYEVTTEGTVKYPWFPELLDNQRVVGFFTADIRNFSPDSRLATLFTLENQLGRKLDIRGCLRYLWQSMGVGKSEAQKLNMAEASKQDMMNLLPGSFVKQGRKYKFCLPFTCATLVNIVLNRLLDYEPAFTGHLAQSACLTLDLMTEMLEFGSIYDLQTDEWVVENG